MLEERSLTCTVCPLGCSVKFRIEKGEITNIEGYSCIRGKEYAITEFKNPVRTLTTTVKVENGELQLVPVKSSKPIPKHLMLEAMKVLNRAKLHAPVHMGDLVAPDILNTGIDIVATREIKNMDEG
jgi:CxxC motif-containing protein